MEALGYVYFNNTVLQYLIAAGIIVIGSSVIQLFKRKPLQRLKQWASTTDTRFDDLLIESIERFGVPALHFFILYAGISTLHLPPRGQAILHVAVTLVITYFFIRLISSVIHLMLRSYVLRQDRGEEKARQLGGLMLIINILVWSIGLLFLFDNMGYDITAIIAGLGIGGIAIALAAQNILGDLFNYFVIFFDRPFEVGDFVVVDAKAGTIEHIGIKTTRVKALSGEQLVFANTDLTNSRIHNYKRMNTRRIVFNFGVVYQTSYEQLEQIPSIVRSIIEEQELVTFDRAHFHAYGDSSLNFEVVYIILSSEYNKYMDLQQAINLGLFRKFQELGIQFAYPTRTLYLANDIGMETPGERVTH
jgi:small-conductance mechanosensitive channel